MTQLKWWHWALGAGVLGLVALRAASARAAVVPSRRLRAFERPGGGRIRDNALLPVEEMVTVQAPDVRRDGKPLHRDVAAAYLAMVAAGRAAGIPAPALALNSGYRSDAEQQVRWERKLAEVRAQHPEYTEDQVRTETRVWIAPPGHSNHRSGRAADLDIEGVAYSKTNIPTMRRTRTHQWLVQNAHLFGFYPYEREPWHWEYNPPA